MKKLYCPWREQYSSSVSGTKKEKISKDECVFCTQFAQKDDVQYYILKRFDHCGIMLNLYPYNAGHLLVIPYRHVACLSELTQKERADLMEATNKAVEAVNNTFDSQGINLGINIGRAAGAGIPSHLHMHVLPRWFGDTNFMPTIAETKTISFDMQEIYQKLREAF